MPLHWVENLSNDDLSPDEDEEALVMMDSVCLTAFLNVLVVSASALRVFWDCWWFVFVCDAVCWSDGRLVSSENDCHD